MIISTDSRGEIGITVGLIDAIISISKVLKERNLSSKEVKESLKDLQSDGDIKKLLVSNEEIENRKLIAEVVNKLKIEQTLISLVEEPILTKEQIEAEGWKYDHTIHGGSPDTETNIFEKEESVTRYRLEKAINHKGMTISGWFYDNIRNPLTKTLFVGDCPSINEFRTIMKLLNIK